MLLLIFVGSTRLSAQTADFSINIQQGCVPLSGVNFTDISSGGTVQTRNWNLGNGTIINNGAATVGTNYLTAGTFTVTLTATFTNGAVRTATKTVTVHPKPVAAFTSVDTVGCNPHAVSFQDLSTTTTGTITNWQWDFGAGGSTVQNPNFTYTNPGNYQVSLIVRNSWGCSSDAASKPSYIRVYNRPTPGFTSTNVSGCDTPFTVQFTNTTTGAGPITYEWNFGDGSPVSTDINPSHTYTAYGRFTVRLTARIGNNCSSTITTNFYTDIIVGKPTPTITSADTVCVGNTILFSGSATPLALAYNWKWHFSDNAAVNYSQNVNHVFASPGDFEVMLVTSTYWGCADTIRKTIHVKPGPLVDFTADKLIGCAVPFPVQFTSITTPATGLAYQWNFGDGNTSTDPNPLHTYNSTGNFTVTLTITDTSIVNGCSATVSKSSYIRIQRPTVNFTYVPPSGCMPLPVLATAQITNLIVSVDTLIWTWGDGHIDTVINGAITATHIYTVSGSFGIQLTMISAAGCRYSSIVKNVSVIAVCDDDGSGGGGGGGGGGAGFTVGKTCTDKYQVTLNDTVTNTIVTEWDFGDGTIVNTGVLNPITHTYSPPQKVYLVTVTRLDTITGIISTGQKNVIIIDEKADFVPDITDICQNKRVNFNTVGIDSSKIRRYIWDFGDGTPRFIINNQAYFNSNGIWLNGNTNHTYAINGVFYVKLIIEDKLGCLDSLQYPVPVSVAGPQVGFTATNLTSCDAVQTVIFQDTSHQNGSTPIIQWRWNFGDGSPVYITTVDTPITHIYNNPSYYNFRTVTLTIVDAIGCDATVSKPNYIRGYRPKADFFSYDTIRCNMYNVFLYNYSSAYNASYTWHYGDGTTSTGYYGSHTYATNGMYNIKLVVTDENGCKDSITRTSYIKIIEPVADFNIGDTSQCAPAAISFTDNSQYATAWEWDFGDGGTGSTDRNPAPHIYAQPGFYQVRLVVRGVNSCVDTVYKTIRVRGPIATWNLVPSSGCKPYTFTAKVTGSFISTYAWDFGDGTPVNASVADSVITHTYVNAGKYLPNVVLISPEGCPYTLKLADSIIVDSAMALFAPLVSEFCGTGTVSFNDLSVTTSFSSLTSYQWDFGDGSPAATTATPPPHVYGPGNYNVRLIVQSQYGCRDTFTKQMAVVVHSLPAPLITGDSIRCKPGTYQYTANVTSVDAIQTYQWRVNGVLQANNTATLNYNFAAGNYTIGLRVITSNNCSSQVQRNIIIDSVNTNFSVINPIRCADDLNVSFNNLSGGMFNITGHLWSFGDNTTSPLQNPGVHTYPNYGNYNVQLISTSEHGCKDTMLLSPAVSIHALPSVLITGDSIHCTPGTYQYAANVTSIDAIQTYEWRVNGVLQTNNTATLNRNFAAGNYVIGLKVITNNNCTDEIQRSIIIDSVNSNFNVINPIRCADDLNVSFNNLSGGKFNLTGYLWNFGDNTTSPLQNPGVHTYPGHGNYNVRLVATSEHGCKDTMDINPAVVISPLPSVLITGDSIHCAPGTYQYSANINSIDAIQTYEWRVNGVLQTNNTATLNRHFIAGNYIIGLKVITNNNCTDEIQRNIIIDSSNADFSVINPVRCADDLSVSFNNLSGSHFGINSWHWNFGDNSTSSLQLPPAHVYPGHGNYNVYLATTSVHGCTDTARISPAVIIHPLPAALIQGDSINCSPGTYRYTADINSIDAIQTYEWRVNGTLISNNTATLDHNFVAGNYVIGLKVFTNNNCTDVIQKNIIVDSINAAFSVQRPVRCGSTDLTVQFNDLSGSKFGISTYQWFFGDGQQSATAAPSHTYASPGTYNIMLVTTSVHGCTDTFRIPQGVIIYRTPVVDFNGIYETCMKKSLLFTAQVTSEDVITAHAWTVNGAPAGTNTTLNYLFNTAGTFTVALKVTTQNGCEVTQSKTVTIRPLPVPAAAPNTTICTGSSITLNAYDGNTFEWTPAATLQNPLSASPVASPLADTRYKVKVTNQYGCIQYDSVLIRVDEKVKLRHSSDAITCRGTAVRLTASGNTSQFVWSPAAGLNTITGPVVMANPVNTTTYRVVGISANVCPSDTGYILVTVGDIPTVNAGPDIRVNAGTQVTLPATSTGGVVQYLWTPSTGLSCTDCPQPSFVADFNTTYKVRVRTQYGCEATDEIVVTVLCNKGAVYIPTAFTPNNDGKNDMFYVNGYGIARVKHFSVFDRWGKQVFRKDNITAGDRNQGWNGRVGNVEITTTTTFVYVAEVECSEGTTIVLKGSVILIR